MELAMPGLTMDTTRRLLDILIDFHGNRRSGVLRVQRQSEKKQLALHDGMLAFAESNVPQEHLARIMVSMGLLTGAKLNEIASSMKAGKTSEEAILALPGSKIDDLEKARREQAILIVSSMLGWGECDPRFYSGDDLVRHQFDLRLKLPELAVLAVRRAVAKRLLPVPAHFPDGVCTPAGDIAFKRSAFPLNAAELCACSLLKDAIKTAAIVSLLGAKGPEPEQTLLCLHFLGLIVFNAAENPDPAGIAVESSSDSIVQRLDEMLAQFESASLYQVLSVGANASQEEIQAAYHEQAKQLHPDRFQTKNFTAEIRGKAEHVFAKINEAYLTLKNPASRALYDEMLPRKRASTAELRPGAAHSEETAEALYREGRALLAKGELETAVERLKGCVWLRPEKAVYHHYLGVAQSEIPKMRKSAEQHLLKAIELEDMSAASHLALASLYIKVSLPRKAEQQLRQALLWDPHNSEAQKLAAELKKLR